MVPIYFGIGMLVHLCFFAMKLQFLYQEKNRTSKKIVNKNDIITVDLSPQNNNIW